MLSSVPAPSPAKFSDQLTAWSTFGLAVLTLFLFATTLWLACRTVRGIRDELNATREATKSAEASARRQLEASYRPVLIEVHRNGPFYSTMGAERRPPQRGVQVDPRERDVRIGVSHQGHVEEIDPRRVWVHIAGDEVCVYVALRNVGTGLAVVQSGEVELSGVALGEMRIRYAKPNRVPPGETTEMGVTCSYRIGEVIAGDAVWRLSVPYVDLAGGQATVAEILLRRNPNLEITEPDGWFVWDVIQSAGSPRSARAGRLHETYASG